MLDLGVERIALNYPLGAVALDKDYWDLETSIREECYGERSN